MNEIRIDKSFNPQSHAAEANLYPRGVARIRQTQPARSEIGEALGSLSAGLGTVNKILGKSADFAEGIRYKEERKQKERERLAASLAAAARESRQAADQVELTRLNNFAREQVLRLDGVTNEKMLEEKAQGFRETFAQMISDNQNLSDDGRKQANIMLEKSVGAYRLEGVAQINRYWKNQQQMQAADSLNQAVAAGDLSGALNWFDRSLELGVTPQYSLDKYKSMTFANGYFNSPAIQGMGIGALRNELTKISATAPDGSSKEFPMIKGDELENLKTRLKRRINDLVNAGEQKLDILLAQDQLTPDIVDALVQQGIIGVEQGNAALAIIKNSQARTAAVIKADQKERQEQETARIGNAMFDAFDNMEVYSPSQLSQIEADINLQISRATADGLLSGPQRLGLKKELKKYGDDARRPDGGIRGTDIFKYAMTTISDLEKSGALSVGVAKDGWFGTYLEQEGKDDPAFQRKRAVELRGFITDRLMANPDATPDDVEAWIKGRVEALNRGVIQKLYQPIPEPEVGHVSRKNGASSGLITGEAHPIPTPGSRLPGAFNYAEWRGKPYTGSRLPGAFQRSGEKKKIRYSDIEKRVTDPQTGRLVWKLKNGEHVWADEYEQH